MTGCAVVTGASRGIGRACALAFAERGLDVALIAREVARLNDVAAEIMAKSVRALTIRCDVASVTNVTDAADEVLANFGTPQVVVNNAGVVVRTPLHEMSEREWDEVLGVNLKGTFSVTRAFVRPMSDRGSGRLINIGSISATLGTAGLTAYCAAKWGVLGFTKALAEELRGSGLQTMCVLPGSVDTNMLKGSGYAPQMSPQEVARVVVYAALDAPDAMNGSAIEVFGP